MSRSVAPEVEHRVIDVDTQHGMARCYVVDESVGQHGTLILGHGAGKGTNTPDLQSLLALHADGWRVVLVDQPWVLQGRRLATRPPTLDEAWREVVEHLRAVGEVGDRLVVGGRSAGARVACRTAEALAADQVIALAFPLIPPKKRQVPSAWRTTEGLAVSAAGIPLHVVQGRIDSFGHPDVVRAALPQANVIAVAGGHGFSAAPDDVVTAVRKAVSFTGE